MLRKTADIQAVVYGSGYQKIGSWKLNKSLGPILHRSRGAELQNVFMATRAISLPGMGLLWAFNQ
jgi:hypothetical protein